MPLINYDQAEKPILEIEKVLEDYDLEEKRLILRFVNDRLQKQITKHKMEEQMQNAKIGGIGIAGLLKKFAPNKEGED